MAPPWDPRPRILDDTIHLDDAEISFHRTVRVPDGETASALPPSLGTFPLYNVKDFLGKLPYEMGAKGGLFMPMYRQSFLPSIKFQILESLHIAPTYHAQTEREAMWIKFDSKHPYAIKVYVGGVNAVSGEPMIENAATRLRRQTLMQQRKSIQDYVIIPEQRWIDGIATGSGQVRQFVATPVGSGYSIEIQMTGEETTGGLQFEITPAERELIRLNINSRMKYRIDRNQKFGVFRRMLEEDPELDFGPSDYVWYQNRLSPRVCIKGEI
jgi:hypothetical protein